MHAFRDASGREWRIEINNGAIKRVRGALGLDLRSLITEGARGFGELIDDDIRLGEVVYELCRPNADVTQEQFEAALGGDVNAAMSEAFVEEFIDFFKDRSAREMLRRLMAKAKEMATAAMADAERTVTSLEQQDAESLLKKLSDARSLPPAS